MVDRIAVSPVEAASMIGVSRTTFYTQVMPLVYGGTIESLKIGRRRVIVIESLKAWVKEQARG